MSLLPLLWLGRRLGQAVAPPACRARRFQQVITRDLGCAAYVRYVDDFALFADDKRQLWAWHRAIIDRMARMRLTLHQHAHVMPVEQGVPWLGFVVYPQQRWVKPHYVVNFRRRFAEHAAAYHACRINCAQLDASVNGWINHVSLADTWGPRCREIDSKSAIRASLRPDSV